MQAYCVRQNALLHLLAATLALILARSACVGAQECSEIFEGDDFLVTQTVLDNVENDFQKIVDCVPDQAKLTIARLLVIKPKAPVTLQSPITIMSKGRRKERSNFLCPNEGKQLFTVSSPGVELQNLVISDCVMRSERMAAVIIDIPQDADDRNSPLVINSVDFVGNRNRNGTASLYVASSKRIVISGTKFLRNSGVYGGGVFLNSGGVGVDMTNCLFEENKATHSIANSGNQQGRGAGFFQNASATVTISGSKFLNNNAQNTGGAMVIFGEAPLSTMTIVDTRFQNNTAFFLKAEVDQNGGAIWAEGPALELKLDSCTFIKNRALAQGGALFLRSSKRGGEVKANIANTTFQGNLALTGAGIFAEGGDQWKLYLNMFESSFLQNKALLQDVRPGGPFEKAREFPFIDPGSGGAITCIGSSIELLSRGNLFEGNSAISLGGPQQKGAHGGAISMVDVSVMVIVDTAFRLNQAINLEKLGTEATGGAIHIESTGVQVARVLNAPPGSMCSRQCDGDSPDLEVFGISSHVGGCGVLDSSVGTVCMLKNATHCKDQLPENDVFRLEAMGPEAAPCTVSTLSSQVNISDTIFVENIADGAGGGLFSSGRGARLSMPKGVEFLRNQGLSGGGLSIEDGGTMTTVGIRIEGNRARSDGEGVIIQGRPDEPVIGDKTNLGTKGGSSGIERNIPFSRILATRGQGGGIVVVKGAEWIGEGAVLLRNTAARGGGALVIKDEGSKVTLTNATFSRNTAMRGGAVEMEAGPQLSLTEETIFSKNQAKEEGGAIAVIGSGILQGEDMALKENFAASGGAIYANSELDAIEITLKSTEFIANYGGLSEAEPHSLLEMGRGGAIFLEGQGVDMIASFMIFNDNMAKEGGAVRLMDTGTVEIANGQFMRNSALSGGSIHVSYSKKVQQRTLTLTDVKIEESTALLGGGLLGNAKSLVDSFIPQDSLSSALFSRDLSPLKQIVMKRVAFWDNVVTGSGGGILLMDVGADCEDCAFTRNIAKEENEGTGGAVALADVAVLDLRQGSFENNQAWVGGAVAVKDSFLRANNLVATQNKAGKQGGAISVEVGHKTNVHSAPQVPSLFLRNSSMTYNNASIGGAIHGAFNAEHSLSDCFEMGTLDMKQRQKSRKGTHPQVLSRCGSKRSRKHVKGAKTFDVNLVIEETEIQDNAAVRAGGAIWVNRPEALCTCCDGFCSKNCGFLKNDVLTNSTKASKLPLQFVLFDACSKSWKRNLVELKGYGDMIASAAESARVLDSGQFELRSVKNHTSGHALPTITVTVFDAFGQVVSKMDEDVFVRVISDDGVVSGQLDKQVEGGSARFNSTVLTAKPGEYSLRVEMPLGLQSRTIKVKVRDCHRGEVAVTGDDGLGFRCERCESGFYSFNAEECSACPGDSKSVCDGRTLVPREGYWHASSWSTSVEECLTPVSCAYPGRVELLQEQSIALDQPLTFEGNYSLCAEGYNGPLCGACEDGFGRAPNFECTKCPKRSLAILYVLFAAIWFGMIVAFLTYNAITVGAAAAPSVNARSAAILAFPIASDSLRRQWGAENSMERGGSGAMMLSDPGMDFIVNTNGSGDTTRQQRLSGNTNASSTNRDLGNQLQPIVLTSRWGASAVVEEAKILINFLQVNALALMVNMQWRTCIEKILSWGGTLSAFSMDGSLFPLDCAFSGPGVPASIKRSILVILYPVGIIVTFAIFWTIRGIIRGKDAQYILRRTIASLVVIFYVFYMGMTKQILRILYRVEIDTFEGEGSSIETATGAYWVEDTHVGYFSKDHAILAGALGGPFLLLVSIGYPLALLLFLRRNRDRMTDQRFVSTYGFLYRAYNTRHHFWEIVVVMRKALLVCVVIFAYPLGGSMQCILMVAILMATLVFHMLSSPYCKELKRMNLHETMSMVGSILTFLIGLMVNDDTLPNSAKLPLSVVLIILICSIGIFLFWRLLKEGGKHLDKKLAKAGLRVPEDLNLIHKVFLFLRLRVAKLKQKFAVDETYAGSEEMVTIG